MVKTAKLTLGQELAAEIDSFCDRNEISVAALCREAVDGDGYPTSRSTVMRWKTGDSDPTWELVRRFRAAMTRVTARRG